MRSPRAASCPTTSATASSGSDARRSKRPTTRGRLQRRLARPLRGTDEALVIDQLDTLLDRYGGVGAYARKDQLSNWFLMNELEQLRTLSRMLADGVPRRRRVSHQHGAGAPHRRGAQLHRSVQGLRLSRARHRVSLREARARDRAHRRRHRLGARILARASTTRASMRSSIAFPSCSSIRGRSPLPSARSRASSRRSLGRSAPYGKAPRCRPRNPCVRRLRPCSGARDSRTSTP
jgi:hypothetical protein